MLRTIEGLRVQFLHGWGCNMSALDKYKVGAWYPRIYKDKCHWSQVKKLSKEETDKKALENKIRLYLEASEGW